MELVGTIAVITSVLVFAWQARELAKQSRIANQVAGAETNRELLLMFRDVHRVFIDHPGLRPQFYDQATAPPNAGFTVGVGTYGRRTTPTGGKGGGNAEPVTRPPSAVTRSGRSSRGRHPDLANQA